MNILSISKRDLKTEESDGALDALSGSDQNTTSTSLGCFA
jgi:hypothetical protein